ncbi:MAG TPA: GNAT family N-acetyltransferase [Edaphobacter sp.]
MTSTLFQLETARLQFRPWQDEDRSCFAALCANPEVMRYFAAPLLQQQSNEAINRYVAFFERDGFCMMPARLRETNEFIGVIGIQTMRDIVDGLEQPAVEVGWRLLPEAQGKGLATEGARAFLDHGFHTLHLPQIVAITAVQNAPSRRVMEKLNMIYRPELDFDHPRVPDGHPHRRHVLYSLRNPDLESQEA